MDPSEQVRRITQLAVRDGRAEPAEDHVAREEPLELQLHGFPLAVIMRTPGHDEELAMGFLRTEGVVADATEVVRLEHCSTVPDPEAEDNVVLIHLRDGVPADLERLRRNIYASSSCGVCGKATIENALRVAPPIEDPVRFSTTVLAELPDRLRASQTVFDATGGLHAAGLFDTTGKLEVAREDVGRHNAVDKVIGWALRAGHGALAGRVLMVSGRVSFEIVQKAAAARIPVVAAVSAPSSLALETAEALGVTVVGFLRGRSMNVYTQAQRVQTLSG